MIHFLNGIRHCVHCGKSWGFFSWLCPECEAWFYLKVKRRTCSLGPSIENIYLVDWVPGDDLTPLVHSLKGGGRMEVFKRLIAFWGSPGGVGPVFYPTQGKKDHAWELAQTFAKNQNRSIQGLKKKSVEKQALLSRSQRSQSVQFQKFPGGRRSVDLVDDIVTTGSTARACWRALGQPAKMTVWSVFYRKSL